MDSRAVFIAVLFLYVLQTSLAKWQPIKELSLGKGQLAKLRKIWKHDKGLPVGDGRKSKHRAETHIVGGELVDRLNTTAGFMASIQFFDGTEWIHRCGGTLVSRDKVLTLGLCGLRYHLLGEGARVGLGYPDLDSIGQPGTQTIEIRDVEFHRHFEFTPDWVDNDAYNILQTGNDIAIFTIEHNIEPTATVYPVKIMRRGEVEVGQWCRVLGYGFSPMTGDGGNLKEAQVYTVPRSVCQETIRRETGIHFRMTKKRVCASTYDPLHTDPDNPKDHTGISCTEDEGGPIICDGRLWGIVEFPGCNLFSSGADPLTVAVRVQSFKHWINNKMQPPSCSYTEEGCCDDCSGEYNKVGACPMGGCAGTEFGCCPGTTSPATGPDYEGCPQFSCAESNFGCCPCSGDRAAKGVNYQGCPFRRSVPPPEGGRARDTRGKH